MTDTKWTAGPWTVETHHRQGADRMVPVWYVKDSKDVGVAVQPAFSAPQHEEANAQPIAAAPDLYDFAAALDASWTEAFPDGPDGKNSDRLIQVADEHRTLWRQCRAALRKANPTREEGQDND